MIRRFIYRAPEPGEGGGGGSTEPTLAEIEAGDSTTDNADKGGDDGEEQKKLADLEAEKQKAADEEAQREADRLKLEEEEKKKEKAKKDADDTPNPDDNKTPEGEEEEDDAEQFIAELNKLRGDELDVDYGDVDPLSVEGVLLREEAVAEKAIADFEEHLEKRFPKAFAYLNHVAAGKPEEEFFGKATNLDTLPTVEELDASVEVQKNIVLKDLIAKGNSEKHAELIIKQAVEDNELEELAKTSLESRTNAQKAEMDSIKKAADAELAQKEEIIERMATYVDSVVNEGKIGNITIPEKERAEFAEVFKKGIRHENGNFVFVSTLTDANIAEVFAKEFYAFKKGDLGKIVQTEAKTQNAIRLKRTVPKAGAAIKGSSETKGNYVTLGELEAG